MVDVVVKNILVLKIGGGVLQNKDCFERVVKIVKQKREEFDGVIIVLSALFGVTDFLIDNTRVFSNEGDISEVIKTIEGKHVSYLNLLNNKKFVEEAIIDLRGKISVLEKFFYGTHYLKEITPRSKDLIQCYGEKLSPIVLEAFLKDYGVDAEFLDAEKAGIMCQGSFENAFIDLEKTSNNFLVNVLPVLKEKVVLLPGFYGVDENSDIKTFGRGGTDYSAGVIANIFSAKLEIWKDVSGFMSADPKLIPNAKQINVLSYDEAEELGYLGAKILHPKTINPLRKKDLCAEIKNLFEPERKGTIICSKKELHDSIIKSVTLMKNVGIVTIKSSTMASSSGFATKVFDVLGANKISINLIATTETSISVSVNLKDVLKAVSELNKIGKEFDFEVTSREDLSLISVVGEGMRETPGVAGKLFSVLGEKNINIELISQGASSINISFVVDTTNVNLAVQEIHKKFLEERV